MPEKRILRSSSGLTKSYGEAWKTHRRKYTATQRGYTIQISQVAIYDEVDLHPSGGGGGAALGGGGVDGGGVVRVPVAGAVLAAEDAGVQHEDVEQLGEGEDDDEGLQHPQPPPPVPPHVDLLAGQPARTPPHPTTTAISRTAAEADWRMRRKEKNRKTHPKASAVTAQATVAEAAAAARLSLRQDRMWLPPASLEATPSTPARMANTRK